MGSHSPVMNPQTMLYPISLKAAIEIFSMMFSWNKN